MKTFIHKFNPSLACTVHISDTAPEPGTEAVQKMEWKGKPKPKHLAEYARWCHEVNREMANVWGLDS